MPNIGLLDEYTARLDAAKIIVTAATNLVISAEPVAYEYYVILSHAYSHCFIEAEKIRVEINKCYEAISRETARETV